MYENNAEKGGNALYDCPGGQEVPFYIDLQKFDLRGKIS